MDDKLQFKISSALKDLVGKDLITSDNIAIFELVKNSYIQSFPDWFEFKSKYTTGGQMRKKEVPRYSQVGNAIPPLFAQQAGLVLKEML